MDDYYSILLVDKNASQEEIKKSYKKLALQYHPDRNNAKESEDKFKQIANAYQVLSDTNKKKLYDTVGKVEFTFDDPLILFQRLFPSIPPEVLTIGSKIIKQINENDDFDINTIKRDDRLQDDILELTDILTKNIPEPIKNMFKLLKKNIPEDKTEQDEDDTIEEITTITDIDDKKEVDEENTTLVEIETQIMIRKEDMVEKNDVDMVETINYNEIDLDIHHKMEIDVEELYNNECITTSLMVLRYCDNVEETCPICSGKSYYLVRKHFRIPNTYRTIKLKNEGHHNEMGQGDLYITLSINSDKKYKILNDYDLISVIDISIYDLYFGNTIYLSHLNKNIGLRIPPKLKNNTTMKCIYNLGLPKENGTGNLYIVMNLIFPDSITDDTIERYFPQIPKREEELDMNKTVEIYRI